MLSHRRGTRMVRTRVEVQEQTEVGDALVRGLVRAQLGLALRLATLVFGTFAVIASINVDEPGRLEVNRTVVFEVKVLSPAVRSSSTL